VGRFAEATRSAARSVAHVRGFAHEISVWRRAEPASITKRGATARTDQPAQIEWTRD
jgi:hypothetical protein